jgi:glycine dehydrogenase subunit 1
LASYVPHTDEDLARMLADLGLSSLGELFACVPEALRLAGGLDLPRGLPEADVAVEMARLAGANRAGELICFAGGGAYDHDVPAVTRALSSRPELVTAYTPYQPEVAQGVLQALFEYQTLVSRLAGLPVANASLYDGATALVEAVNLALAATGRQAVWVSEGINPRWRDVLSTLTTGSGARLVSVRLHDGQTDWASATAGEEMPAALIVASPNYLGCLDPVAQARRAADAAAALLITVFDPVAAGLLWTPGQLGADVAVAEGQPMGTPLAFGGPYLGMFAVAQAHVRRLPGRLVGRGSDWEGRVAYVSTLRAREQDIRREKASSNICTNQTLVAIAAMVQLAWLGTAGLRELALRCARGARYLRESLLSVPGARPLVGAPVVREFAIELPVAPELAIERMAEEGFLAGLPVRAEGREGLLVAVTEKRTRAEIDAYVRALEKVVT